MKSTHDENEDSNLPTMGPPVVDPIRQAYFLVILMMLMPWASADVSHWQGPESTPDEVGLSPSNSTYDGFVIPSNSTITGAEYNIAPQWVEAPDNGTIWSTDTGNSFSAGVSDGTSSLTSAGDLRLSPKSTYGEMTDFEASKPQFSTWSSQGDEFWMPVNLSLVNYGPQNATSGDIAAGTNGSIPPGYSGYIRSQFWPVPDVVRYFNLTFDRWNSFDLDDIAEFHYSIDNGLNWITLDNWSGASGNWVQEFYSLDNLTKTATSIGFRFYVSTSTNSGNDIGLFIDSFNLTNVGEPIAAWFHGNASGQYSPNADGTLIVPVDLSGLTSPLELTYWANWDMQGGYYDNLVVMVSENNGSTWTIMSPLPGVPGQGMLSGGSLYSQTSYGWRELMHPFPPSATSNPNAANTLLKFRITTDSSINYGANAVDGWEGMMIDDLKVISAGGTPAMQIRNLHNFTDNSTQTLETSSGYPNDWQHIDWEGHNGPWSNFDSFENIQALPSGWRVDHIRGSSPWERGNIDNSNGYGPNSTVWPSGSKGMGINLQGIYSNNVYTHLVSPIYSIPSGATARLTFSHWVCTEAAWDGGTIFTSTDDGLTWQPFGQNISGFYERVSQINVNSPLYGLGIFDGSSVPNGCGTSNANHTFSRVSGDISDLAGENVRIRFTFFTDTYVEEDGWYIDDAGIVIDRFRPNGTWTSPLVTADESGWGRLTSIYEIPNGTELLTDVLDVNGQVIQGHSNLSLPFDINVGTWQHNQLKFRLKFFTTDEKLTPSVLTLHHGATEYLNRDLMKRIDSQIPDWIFDSSLIDSNTPDYLLKVPIKTWRPYSDIDFNCDGNVSLSMFTIDGRIPFLSNGYPTSMIGQSSLVDEGECGQIVKNSYGPSVASEVFIKISPEEIFNWIKVEPISLLSPVNPSIDLGDDSEIDWMWNGTFHHSTNVHHVAIDGNDTTISDVAGFSANYTSELQFSVLLPARNFSAQSWNCGLIHQCYNGGINVQTNGNSTPSISENFVWINNSGFSHYMSNYTFRFNTNTSTEFNLISANFISGMSHSIMINTSLEDKFQQNLDSTSSLPVTVSVDRGGIIFDGDIFHEKPIVDDWVSLPQSTFRPGYIQSAVSSHRTIVNSPNLHSVNLQISTSTSISDSFVDITLDNLETGGRFIQNSGAGILSLDQSNSSWDGENVTWSLESKWLLDDSARLYWFISGTNSDDISMGPVMGVSGTAQYAASTNDLEVIGFKSWANNRSLHDFSNPMWPLNVKGDEIITVQGEVRYSGLNNVHPNPDDLDIIINVKVDDVNVSQIPTSIDSDGTFNTSFTAPNIDGFSGKLVSIIPTIQNIGDFQTTTAYDTTSSQQHVDFVLDLNNSEIISLEIDAPGGNQPADGHVWHFGQDIPLLLHVRDDNGLSEKMEIFYNRSGRNWESIEFLTPVGSQESIIDLPFIDESSVPLANEETGWLDVYVTGFDLAGNPLNGGGSAENPLARILVQPRYSTWINGESISFDLHENKLLPGKTHEFNFTVSDENGINSIDMVQLDLINNRSMCEIDWYPWRQSIEHDDSCFIRSPVVETSQRFQTNTWDVKFKFELRWDIEEDLGTQLNTPSLRLWDENAPLEGFTSISLFAWTIHNGVELEIANARDKISPIGQFVNDIVFIYAQDIVDIDLVARYKGTGINAENLPFNVMYEVEIIGDLNYTTSTGSFNVDGTSTTRVVFDSSLYGTQVKIIAKFVHFEGQYTSGDSIDVMIDYTAPSILVSSGYLVSIDSDKLDSVPVRLTVSDPEGVGNDSVMMFWNYMRQGRIVESSMGAAEIPIEFMSVRSNLYSAFVDMNTSADIQKGDSLRIWFEGRDASGREITGYGSNEVEPINAFIRWIAYEPQIEEMIATPYRPQIGDIVTIEVTIKNIGLIDGQSNLTLLRSDGKVLESLNLSLLVGMDFVYQFEIEAWKTGDLGLQILLDEQQAVPVPISSVSERIEKNADSETMLLGLAVLSVFIAGILVVIANSRRNSSLNYHEEE